MGLLRWLFGGKDREPDEQYRWFVSPNEVLEAHLLIEKPKLIPDSTGAYAWYFDTTELKLPKQRYQCVDDFKLLYIGIAGDKKKPDSKATLRDRIRWQHLRGNAYGSSLRLSLGILLQDVLRLELEPQGSKGFHWSDESALSEWMAENALVTWIVSDTPWEIEENAVSAYGKVLPLNYEHNESDTFAAKLHEKKKKIRRRVRDMRTDQT